MFHLENVKYSHSDDDLIFSQRSYFSLKPLSFITYLVNFDFPKRIQKYTYCFINVDVNVPFRCVLHNLVNYKWKIPSSKDAI